MTTAYIGKLTREKAAELSRDDQMIEFVVHPALIPALVAWLNSMDADLVQGPPTLGDTTPWFIFSPRSIGRSDG